jgi:hypothetical protein
MLVLKHMQNNTKLEQLHCTFPKLTEVNQQYVLGLAEGLKHAQNKTEKLQEEKATNKKKTMGFGAET